MGASATGKAYRVDPDKYSVADNASMACSIGLEVFPWGARCFRVHSQWQAFWQPYHEFRRSTQQPDLNLPNDQVIRAHNQVLQEESCWAAKLPVRSRVLAKAFAYGQLVGTNWGHTKSHLQRPAQLTKCPMSIVEVQLRISGQRKCFAFN